MKTFFTMLLALFAIGLVSAQVTTPPVTGVAVPPTTPHDTDEYPDQVEIDPAVPDTNEIFLFADEFPHFPGGDSAWKVYLRTNLNYPTIERDRAHEGTVYVQFVVEKDGSITNVIVRRHPNSEAMANEAVRVVSQSPNWIPGKINGKPVRVQLIVPIRFTLH